MQNKTKTKQNLVEEIITLKQVVKKQERSEAARMRAEAALRDNESLLKEIIDKNPIAMAIVSLNGTIEYLNRRAIETFGYELTDIPDMEHWWKLAYPDEAYRTEVMAQWTGLVEKAIAQNSEIERRAYQITCKNGTVKTVAVFGTLTTDKLFAMFDDITDRKQMEILLKESERKYRSLAATVDRMVLVDKNCVILFANEAFLKRFSSSETIIGKKFSNVHSLEGSRTFAEGVARVLKTGIPSQDSWFVARTGKHWLRTFSPVKDEEENVSAVTVSYKDVTELKQIEESLRKSEEKYRSLASIEDRAFVLDRDCRYLFANENYLDLFAPESDLVAGRKYGELHNEERSRAVIDAVKYVFETGNVYQNQHFGVRTGQYFLQKFSPFRNSDGSIYAVTVISIDITSLKLAEEALRESEAKYRALASTVDSLLLVDRNCRHLFANKAYLDRFGTTEDAIIGREYSAFHNVESSEQFAAAVKYVFETGASCQVERLGERSGRYWLKTFSPVKNAEGAIESVTVAYKNITEHKQIEEELRKSVENYRALATTVDALFSVDRNYVMTSANENFLKRLRPHNTGPMIGESIDIIHNPGQAMAIRKGVDTVFSTGKPYYDELWAYYTSMYLIRTFSPVFDERGNVVSVTVASKDMTERKLAEMELEQSEEKYRSLASTVDGLFLVDRNCRYLYANQAYLGTFGTMKDLVIGKKHHELHDEEADRIFTKAVKYVLETGNSHQDEWFGKKSNKYVMRTYSPVYQSDGYISAVTVVAKDITERKRAEEKVRISLKEKEFLLREIHHRVKNNMQVISSLLNLQGSASGHPDIFENCQQRIRSMALIHEKTYKSSDLTRIDLVDYTRELAQELIQAYALNPAKIELIIEANNVYTDINKATPCGLILNELITNALKHAFPVDWSGELRIAISETENSETQIVLHDNGLGLPEDVDPHQPKGIGLYLVNGLVKNQLGGQWEVTRNHGTEVRITFPA